MGHTISLLIKDEEKEGFLIPDCRRFGLRTARRRRLKSRLPTLACEEVIEDPRPADSRQTRRTWPPLPSWSRPEKKKACRRRRSTLPPHCGRRGRRQSTVRDLRSVAVSFSSCRTRKSKNSYWASPMPGSGSRSSWPDPCSRSPAQQRTPASGRWRQQVLSTGVWPLWMAEIYFANILIIWSLIGDPFVPMDSLQDRSTQLWKKIDNLTVNEKFDGSERKKLFLQYRSHLELDFRSIFSHVLMVRRSTK